ncbi:MAG: homoserine kinase [Syntrophomonadaceae bacterium]|nr:homoserine kinase [Syntrophomonadaceae bacterium]MDD3889370.1 homoserine kinase [Syntrophomonadaceae bacterium]MDD4548577.1 homoserine kinase [Syntrophomonadaceae bacterium]
MVRVKVPATSANLGPGCDTLGLALNLYLEVTADFAADGASFAFYGYGEEVIRNEPGSNLILKAMQKIFSLAKTELPELRLTVKNNIPFGKGMGSSAAAIVAGMWAANYLLGHQFTSSELLHWAVEMEGHADNIVPAVAGGLTTAMLYREKVLYQKVSLPEGIRIIIVVPDFTLPTEKSRSVLPEKVNLQDAVANIQKACFLLASLQNCDFKNISIAMDDMIYQPWRKKFIPGFDQVLFEARKAGAIGVALSGAGPSIIALTTENEKNIGKIMGETLKLYGVSNQVLYLRPVNSGVIYF